MKQSPQQIDIEHALLHTPQNLFVQARAGTGKTTTLAMCINALPPSSHTGILCCAFNKRIAEELATRLPKNVTSKTLNAVGFALLCSRRLGTRAQVDDKKTQKLLKEIAPSLAEEQQNIVQRLVSTCKQNGIVELAKGIHAFPDWVEDPTEIQSLFPTANRILTKTIEWWQERGLLDFDDMLWLPLVLGLRLPAWPYIFIDEAQDLNPIQLQLLLSAGPRTRYIFFGDPAQAIYAWRGAMSDACDVIIEATQARVLPLTTTYRCSKSIVQEANKYVPDLRATDTASPGSVQLYTKEDVWQHHRTLLETSPAQSTFILCRLNAPLIQLAIQYTSKKLPFSFRTSRFVSNFAGYLRRVRGNNTRLPIQEVLARSETLVADNPHLQDYHNALVVLAEESDDVLGTLRRITSVTSSALSAPLFSTIHSAKGLEADRVLWLVPPTPAKQRVDDQDDNLRYVAITRARRALYIYEL